MLKHSPHAPPHLLLDDTPYFLTGAILEKRRLLRSDALKAELLEIIREAFAKWDWALHDWVILDHHYHLLGMSRSGADLPRLIAHIHGKSSKRIREETGCATPVWWNYWDYCPRNEADYRVRQNYLLYNPVKHGYVTDLLDYPFSSFHALLAEQGREELRRQFREHKGYRCLELEEDAF